MIYYTIRVEHQYTASVGQTLLNFQRSEFVSKMSLLIVIQQVLFGCRTIRHSETGLLCSSSEPLDGLRTAKSKQQHVHATDGRRDGTSGILGN